MVSDPTLMIHRLVRHCDLRKVSPVTCSVKEIIFFLSNVFPKTEQNGGSLLKTPLFLILKILSAVHDLVNGTALEGDVEIR